MPAFLLSYVCIVTDLTPIVTIDRRVRLPLSKWRGHGVGFWSWVDGMMVLQVYDWFEEYVASPPQLNRIKTDFRSLSFMLQ